MNTEEKVLQVPIEDILPNRFQPRLAFDDDSLNDLAASIKQHGIIQPLVLRRVADKYEIIAGERRYKAAKMAGLTAVPAIISLMDEQASAEAAIVENVQRKNLTAIEEARSFKALLDKGYMTQEDLAKKMGLSQAAISNKLRLLTLAEPVQEAVLKENISERHARSLLKIKDENLQQSFLSRIINERLTVKQLEEEIKKMTNITEEGDVPLVNSNPDLNAILTKSTDINTTSNMPPILSTPTAAQPATPQPTAPATPVAAPLSAPAQAPSTPNSPSNIFNTPSEIPNKFFNFLEDEAANMTVEEQPFNYQAQFKLENPVPPAAPTPVEPGPAPAAAPEEIELLDFEAPTPVMNNVLDETATLAQPKIVIEEAPVKHNDDHVDEIIKIIRDLNLNSENVSVEEINLPDEYHINIKIKKNVTQ